MGDCIPRFMVFFVFAFFEMTTATRLLLGLFATYFLLGLSCLNPKLKRQMNQSNKLFSLLIRKKHLR